MKKLLFGIFTIACLIILFLPKKSAGIISIKFATWGSQSEISILKPLIEDFENQNPNIKIDLIHIPQNYFQKLHLLFASNSAPDVLFINNLYLPFFANTGVLKPLSYSKDFELKAQKALSYNGNLYAIPRDISILVIFRNKNLFKKCNIKLNSSDWTFKDFLHTSKQFKQCKRYGISFEERPPLFYLSYLMSEGGGILSDDLKTNIFNTKETQKGLNFYSELRNKYNVAPTAAQSANLTMAQLFLQEKLAMHLTGHWLIPKYLQDSNFEWDTITFPKGSKGSITPLDASGWAISSSSKHPVEAQKFIDFLSSKESIEKFTKSGLIVPARVDVLNGNFKDLKFNKAFIDAIKTSKPTPVSSNYIKLLDNINKQTDIFFNK